LNEKTYVMHYWMVICFPKKGLVGKCLVYGTLTNGSQKKNSKELIKKPVMNCLVLLQNLWFFENLLNSKLKVITKSKNHPTWCKS